MKKDDCFVVQIKDPRDHRVGGGEAKIVLRLGTSSELGPIIAYSEMAAFDSPAAFVRVGELDGIPIVQFVAK